MIRILLPLTLLLPSLGTAQSPAPAPIPGDERTQVLVLGSDHLRSLGTDFRPAMVASLVHVLESFRADVIAVEHMPPREIERLLLAQNEPSKALLQAFATHATRMASEAQAQLGKTAAEASKFADSLLSTRPRLNPNVHRSLAIHFLAAYDLPSAVLQWAHLPEHARHAQGPLSASLVAALDQELARPDETMAIAVELGRRSGLLRIASIDDHIDDYFGLTTGLYATLNAELHDHPAVAEFMASAQFVRSQSRLREAAATGDLLPLYFELNAPAMLDADVRGQWHVFFRTRLPSGSDRARVALWESRNLRIAANLRAAAALDHGRRVLVLIGAAHKPFLDRYLEGMMDVRVVHLADLLQAPRD
jgi:hypothetical protein